MSNYKPLIKPINNFIKIKCWDYLKTHNLGNRGVYDGNKEKQFVGLLAEMETYNLLKGYYPDLDQKENGFDGGIDIVLYDKTIDVKAMGRKYATRANYVNNIVNAVRKLEQEDIEKIVFSKIQQDMADVFSAVKEKIGPNMKIMEVKDSLLCIIDFSAEGSA